MIVKRQPFIRLIECVSLYLKPREVHLCFLLEATTDLMKAFIGRYHFVVVRMLKRDELILQLQSNHKVVVLSLFRGNKYRHIFFSDSVSLHPERADSSQIIGRIRFSRARVLPVVVIFRDLRLVADVAEKTLALDTSKQVLPIFLSIDCATSWTFAT